MSSSQACREERRHREQVAVRHPFRRVARQTVSYVIFDMETALSFRGIPDLMSVLLCPHPFHTAQGGDGTFLPSAEEFMIATDSSGVAQDHGGFPELVADAAAQRNSAVAIMCSMSRMRSPRSTMIARCSPRKTTDWWSHACICAMRRCTLSNALGILALRRRSACDQVLTEAAVSHRRESCVKIACMQLF